MSGNLALKIDDLDNVATIFANGMKKGMSVEIHDKKGHSETTVVSALNRILCTAPLGVLHRIFE